MNCCKFCARYFSRPFDEGDYSHDFWFMGDDEWNIKNS